MNEHKCYALPPSHLAFSPGRQCYALPPNHSTLLSNTLDLRSRSNSNGVREPFPGLYESVGRPSIYSTLRKNLSRHCSWKCASITFMLISLASLAALAYFINGYWKFFLIINSSQVSGACPVLCSGRGSYVKGSCQCEPGWKGKECQIRQNECEISDCNGHGDCIHGLCHCYSGYKGINCDEVSLSLTANLENSNIPCPYDCSGHGTCFMGKCKCDAEFTGDSCEYSVCPVLCSGRGSYSKGSCQCDPGWKGKECQLREDECESRDCSGHGDCTDGQCHCFPGYKGQHCEEVDCLDPDCSGHGVCYSGRCLCGKGWKGADCSEFDSESLRCLPDCSSHGTFNIESGQCICEPRWMGIDCSQEKCDLDCGPNGQCQSGGCVCNIGWTGSKCEQRLCDPRCMEHGQCNNGTCFCNQGWNGKLCTLEGCPRNCNNRGVCVERDGEWFCSCNSDWDGADCSIPLEKECGDKIDNDNDGLIDCADSECCSSKECQNNPLCLKSADPVDILLRKQPLSPTASFFQRMQFLIEEDSVQSYAHRKAFNDSLFWTRFNASQASVIRGRVTSPSGYGLMGVRVGVVNDHYLGIVVSRESGWFDIMVNGGSAVTLDFRREPFKPTQRTVYVPWNQIVVIGEVRMDSDETKIPDYRSPICVEHDYELMRPTISGTWKNGFSTNSPSTRMILEEGQIVQESIQIPGTDVNLLYQSNRASGYLSTIELGLTSDRIPSSLRLVHLKISLEGNLFERIFEAEPNIRFTYSWNRRNVYRQKVFGLATAVVHVGYEYLNCPQVIWEVQSVQLAGHDMSISEVGGWNLDIHHRYNFHEGILQKGDGSTLYLKHLPKIMTTLMGDGQQRPLHCAYCNGLVGEQRLLAPVALTSGADGSIYVGDFNLIRRITPDGLVSTIVELSASQVAYRYHLAMGPVDGKLYISDPEKYQILRVINNSGPSDPRANLEIVVGSGVKCLPGDKSLCGDEQPARTARLAYPKGIAISLNGEIFIADGTNIRYVDSAGFIHTLIGDHFHKLHWKPFPCTGTIPIAKVNLRWPTELAINPLDNSLHILDDHMVLKLTPDKRIRIIAGRPTHCSSVITGEDPDSKKEAEGLLGTQVFLETPQSISFSPNGDLFIAESDSQMINRVRMVTNDGRIVRYAGMDLDCSCMENNCECFNSESVTAANSKMSAVPSITVTPDGSLHICDQGNLRIRSVYPSLPTPDKNSEYHIASPETFEIYVFNRFGQHVSTKSLLTKKTIYTFSYNVNTSFGKLSSVTDDSGNKVHLFRDYSNQVKSIENSKGGKCSLTMSRMRMLAAITSSDGFTYNFEYIGSSGLIKSRLDPVGVNSIFYQYDQFGRLSLALAPNGDTISIGISLILEGATVRIIKNPHDLKNSVVKRDKRSSYLDIIYEVTSPAQLFNASSSSQSSSLTSISSPSSLSSSSSSSLSVNNKNKRVHIYRESNVTTTKKPAKTATTTTTTNLVSANFNHLNQSDSANPRLSLLKSERTINALDQS